MYLELRDKKQNINQKNKQNKTKKYDRVQTKVQKKRRVRENVTSTWQWKAYNDKNSSDYLTLFFFCNSSDIYVKEKSILQYILVSFYSPM